jgi:N-acylglucosamine 2-epimerase
MKDSRRTFINKVMTGAASVSIGGFLPGFNTRDFGSVIDANGVNNNLGTKSEKSAADIQSLAFTTVPGKIAGMTLQELRNDYRERIFKQYLPFWEKGGYDNELGGFMCELNDDGSVVNDEKYIWYQGRGVWVYSYLYNNFGKDKQFLGIAKKSRDFLIKNMYLGDGKWLDTVNRQGKPVVSTVAQGSSKDVYGALFSAVGLIELYKAIGNEEDLEIAKTSIWASVKAYESPDYEGVIVAGIDKKGLRTLGHSFMIVWTLNNLLSFHNDPKLEELLSEHVNHIMIHFWNPDYGINNENLLHDYTRIPGSESVMFIGHYLETLWMLLYEALRKKDKQLFETIKNRIRRLIEMCWDYVFEGLGTEDYYVFSSKGNCLGPVYDLKVMWAHAELLIATMTILEHTGETWAQEWYERGRRYCLKSFANTSSGIWRQAVDRLGNDKQRPGISIYRKDNFHQIRYQMMNLLSIERMIKNDFKISPI